ncbi:MAG: ATP-binding cassette domain-containing protein [Actinomycetota bacterium]
MTDGPARGDVVVEMTGIHRRFGTTIALDGVDLTLRKGEIHAVLGANGAGKTTLMRILAGLDSPDRGDVVVDGEHVDQFDPGAARRAGIALVQQHFTLVPTLSASENLLLARPLGRLRPSGRRLRRHLDELVERFGLPVRDDVPVGALSVGEQQRLELLRALDAHAEILVLDEPTAVLTDAEADQLLTVCRRLADDGHAIAIITHRLGEVFAGCDRVTVLRSGEPIIEDAQVGDLSRGAVATAMIGSESTGVLAAREHVPHETPDADRPVRLHVDHAVAGRLSGVSLDVRAGEIVGIAGVDGNGQSDLEALLSGRVPPERGRVEIDGQPLAALDPRARRSEGVAYIPSDRYRHALVRPMEISDNLELGRVPAIRRPRSTREAVAAEQLIEWDVRAAGPSARAASLSGGNAQKLVLARELDDIPGVVIACYPTRGLDPNAAQTIVERLLTRSADGAAVLWIGAELDELFAVSDRILVLANGRVSGEFQPPFDRSAIGLAMTNSELTRSVAS